MSTEATSSSAKENWIDDVIQGLRETPPISPGWSICKVPRNLRSVNKDAYTPHIVSIGPVHHEDKELLPMEDHKRRYLLALFNRREQPEQMLKDYYPIITGLDGRVRACYTEPIPYDKDKLAKILLHDAGFLLELFFRYDQWINLRIPQNDPIFTTAWMISTLRRDMVLLENQIPFFVLESLFTYVYQDAAAAAAKRKFAAAKRKFTAAERQFQDYVAAAKRDYDAAGQISATAQRDYVAAIEGDLDAAASDFAAVKQEFAAAQDVATELDVVAKRFPLTLNEFALQFFKSILNISEEVFPEKCSEEGNHLLQLLYNCYLPSNPIDSRSEEAWEFIHSATSLDQAGVEFQKNTTNDLFDLQFDNGIFKIPQLLIDDSTDSLFRNLVAFEQSRHDSGHYITSYILLMDRLIDTTNDVHLLQQKQIIENKFGGRGDVEFIFNNISKQIVLKDFYFAALCNQVNAYAKLIFNNPLPKEDWIDDVARGLLETPPISEGWNICKVPRNLRSVNKDAYTPHIVSIGPIHHEDKELLPMEDHKRRYLLALFKRTTQPEEMLRFYYGIITRLEERVRACYAERIPYAKDELAKILLHDAGFLLELFYRYDRGDLRILQNDPIFTTAWMISTLRRDMVLLENQIPFFVLKSLFMYINKDVAADPDVAVDPDVAAQRVVEADFPSGLKDLVLHFFMPNLNIMEAALHPDCREEGNHLLHLLYNCYLPSNPIYPGSEEAWEFIHCATSLDQAGVEFQKNTTNGLFDLQFQNGIFKIPQLLIDDSTDSLFRNLVAFEQSQHGSKHYMTSYILLMDRLIDTTNDVHLLQQKRIIENKLGGRGDVEYIFNNISKQIVLKDFYFVALCNKVNAYAKFPCNRYIAALRRDYFKNPWSILSFVAAITLLVLTFLQTLYSLLSYYQKSN